MEGTGMPLTTGSGLGCVKTFALASRVENLGAIAEAEN
jgi:hypothetical protein